MADVTTTFAAKDENFAKTIDSLQKRMDGFGKKMDGFSKSMSNVGGAMMGVVGKVAGLAAGFMAAQSVIGAFREAIDMGGNLSELSDRTGETAGNLMILQRAFQNSGAGADSVGQQLNKLQRFMYEARDASSEQGKALTELGLSYSDLAGKAPIDQMQMLAEKISSIQDPGQRAAMAMSVFGKAGGELLPLLRGMTAGIDQARAQLGSAPKVADELARSLDTIGENFSAIAGKGTEFAMGLLRDITPALLALTTEIANLDAAGLGEKLSKYIARTMEWAKETFKLGETFKNIKASINAIIGGDFSGGFSLMFRTAEVAGKNMINVLLAAAMAAISVIGSSLFNIFSSKSGFLSLIDSAFSYMGNAFQSSMAKALKGIMQEIPFMSQGAIDAMGKVAYEAGSVANGFKVRMGNAISQIGKDIKKEITSAPEEFAANYDANMKQPLFDIEEQSKKNAAEAERLAEANERAAEAAKRLNAAAEKPTVPQPPLEPTEPAPAPTPAPAPAPVPTVTAGGGTSVQQKAKTYLEALGSQEGDYSVAKSMKISDQLSRDQARAQKLAERGSYRAAASTLRRSKEKAERRARRALENDLGYAMSAQAVQPEDIKAGQSQAESATQAAAATDPLIKWLNENIYKWMQENLPSHALT